MVTTRTVPLTRRAISQFIPQPIGIRAIENLQSDAVSIGSNLTGAQVLVISPDTTLGNERVLTPEPGDLLGRDGGAGQSYTLGLASSGVVAGSYGDASHLVSVAIDTKGRITSAAMAALNSDHVTEGTDNLFFTTTRAQSAITGGAGIIDNAGIISLETSGVTSGTYGGAGVLMSISVDQYGRVIAASQDVLSAGAGVSVNGNILALVPSGVAAGTYTTIHAITIDAYGRVTAIS